MRYIFFWVFQFNVLVAYLSEQINSAYSPYPLEKLHIVQLLDFFWMKIEKHLTLLSF
jgi:hypothetical protein